MELSKKQLMSKCSFLSFLSFGSSRTCIGCRLFCISALNCFAIFLSLGGELGQCGGEFGNPSITIKLSIEAGPMV